MDDERGLKQAPEEGRGGSVWSGSRGGAGVPSRGLANGDLAAQMDEDDFKPAPGRTRTAATRSTDRPPATEDGASCKHRREGGTKQQQQKKKKKKKAGGEATEAQAREKTPRSKKQRSGSDTLDDGDFKENLGRHQPPAITTRHLQVGERSFVCKMVNTSSGVSRLFDALKGRPLMAWRLAMRDRATEDEDSGDEALAAEVHGNAEQAPGADLDVSTEKPVEDDAERVLGLGVACSSDTCWFLSAVAFSSPSEFWGTVCKILRDSDALKVSYACHRGLVTLLRHGIDLSDNTNLAGSQVWDVAVAVWALQDEGADADANARVKVGHSKSGTVSEGGKERIRGHKKSASKGKSSRALTQGLHKSCLLHAPAVAGRKEKGSSDDERRCAIFTIRTLSLHISLCGKPPAPLGLLRSVQPSCVVGVGVGGKLDSSMQRALQAFDMPLLPLLARAEYSGVCVDLSRLSDISNVLRQRSAHLEEDLEVQRSVRRAVCEAAQGAAWFSQMDAQRSETSMHSGLEGKGGEGGGLWRISTTAAGGGAHLRDISKKEDALIARIESELDMLLRLRRISNSFWRAARRSDGERCGKNNADSHSIRERWQEVHQRLGAQMRLSSNMGDAHRALQRSSREQSAYTVSSSPRCPLIPSNAGLLNENPRSEDTEKNEYMQGEVNATFVGTATVHASCDAPPVRGECDMFWKTDVDQSVATGSSDVKKGVQIQPLHNMGDMSGMSPATSPHASSHKSNQNKAGPPEFSFIAPDAGELAAGGHARMVESDANDVSQSLPAEPQQHLLAQLPAHQIPEPSENGPLLSTPQFLAQRPLSLTHPSSPLASVVKAVASEQEGRSGDGQDRRERGLWEAESEDELMDDAFLAELDFLEASAIMQDGLKHGYSDDTNGGDKTLGHEHTAQQAVGRRLWRLHPVPETCGQGALGAVGLRKPALHALPPPAVIPLDHTGAHESLHNRWVAGNCSAVTSGTLVGVSKAGVGLPDDLSALQRAIVVRDVSAVGPPPWNVFVQMIVDFKACDASFESSVDVSHSDGAKDRGVGLEDGAVICVDARHLHLLHVETLTLDFRDTVIAEPGCVLLSCTIPHLPVWALALLSRDMEFIRALGGFAEGEDSCTIKGVWERVGSAWTERGNIGFSVQSAPVKAEAMCYGLALGKGHAAMARDLDISLEEVDSWISAFHAAFPVLGRTISALKRGSAAGRDERFGEKGRCGGFQVRSVSGRLLVDSSLPVAGWERVRKAVAATCNDIKKALLLSACQGLRTEIHGAGMCRDRLQGGSGEGSFGGGAPQAPSWGGDKPCAIEASRFLMMTSQGVLLQVASTDVDLRVSEVKLAFARVTWPVEGTFAENAVSSGAKCGGSAANKEDTNPLVLEFSRGNRFGGLG